eukprot:1176363-Prorocentrum_minimum.AAC.3
MLDERLLGKWAVHSAGSHQAKRQDVQSYMLTTCWRLWVGYKCLDGLQKGLDAFWEGVENIGGWVRDSES